MVGGSTLACPRCKAPMKDVVSIAPAKSDPGLIAYECQSCGYVTSVLIDHLPTTSENNE
jgi:predicted nucleic acid-binding Zn ribbon protein